MKLSTALILGLLLFFISKAQTNNNELFEYEIINDSSARLVKCNDITSKVITIPEFTSIDGKTYTVIEIKKGALNHLPMAELVMPNSITRIEPNNFMFCNNLTTIKYSPNITKIETVFICTNNLQHVELPTNLKSICTNAFAGTQIDSIYLPPSLLQIGNNAFSNTKLRALELPPFYCSFEDSNIDIGTEELIRSNARHIASRFFYNPSPNIHYGNYPTGQTFEGKSHTLELIHLTKTHSYAIAHAKPSKDLPDDYLVVYELGHMKVYNTKNNYLYIIPLKESQKNVKILDYIILDDKIVVIFSANKDEMFLSGSYYFDGYPIKYVLEQDEWRKRRQNRMVCRHLPSEIRFTKDKSKAQLIENSKVIETLSINDFVKKYTF